MGVSQSFISLHYTYTDRFILFCNTSEHALRKIFFYILHVPGPAVINDTTNLPLMPLYCTQQSNHASICSFLSFLLTFVFIRLTHYVDSHVVTTVRLTNTTLHTKRRNETVHKEGVCCLRKQKENHAL